MECAWLRGIPRQRRYSRLLDFADVKVIAPTPHAALEGRAARLRSVGCHSSRSFRITITYRMPEVSRRGAISPESTA